VEKNHPMNDSTSTAPPLRIGRRIQKLRDWRGLKQEDVAERLGMCPSDYSRMERDEVVPTIDKLAKIAEVLDVNIYALLQPDEGQVFQNHGTLNGCGFADTSVVNDIDHVERLYREQIDTLKDENRFLRDQLKAALESRK